MCKAFNLVATQTYQVFNIAAVFECRIHSEPTTGDRSLTYASCCHSGLTLKNRSDWTADCHLVPIHLPVAVDVMVICVQFPGAMASCRCVLARAWAPRLCSSTRDNRLASSTECNHKLSKSEVLLLSNVFRLGFLFRPKRLQMQYISYKLLPLVKLAWVLSVRKTGAT